ncbi:ATP-binding protein [Sedimentibacter sp. zth1]|uniref:ATP-binding protein n=1 Tax=Sedimentibacter sp. zth1 TaxID=2816908 RepID=UPI001A9104EC|nr:ATP-binding protein [Sedimentibacter sp. zth1]QSX05232.1 ATP-binding protein [Sedimentibacter sp. zth1]
MNESVLSKIRTEYEHKRLKALNDLDRRKEKVYTMFPRVEEIDKEIALTSIKLSKIILLKPENVEQEVTKLKEKIDNLRKEKSQIFKDNKIPKNYFEIKYKCSICRDTGFLDNGKRCKCYKQSIIESLYHMSNIKQMLEKENFNEFNINIFSNQKFGDEPITPRQNMYTIFATCEDFCNNFDKVNNSMLFYGGTGLGKTFMCNCIASELIQRGKTVIYQTAANIIDIVENHRFNKNDETQINKENYKFLFDCDLLIIDDLGTEFNNSFTNSELFNIINSRMTSGKKMVVSTNLSLDQLASTYSDRIISRVFNEFAICYFYGKDLRWES